MAGFGSWMRSKTSHQFNPATASSTHTNALCNISLRVAMMIIIRKCTAHLLNDIRNSHSVIIRINVLVSLAFAIVERVSFELKESQLVGKFSPGLCEFSSKWWAHGHSPYDIVYNKEIDSYVNKSKKFFPRNFRAERTRECALQPITIRLSLIQTWLHISIQIYYHHCCRRKSHECLYAISCLYNARCPTPNQKRR